MITLRVDEKALRLVLTLAMQTNHLSRAESAAIKHMANQAAQGVIDEIEGHLGGDTPDIEGVPI